jgi:hypothetical protein
MGLVIRTKDGERARHLARLLREKAPTLTCSGCGRRDFALIDQPSIDLRTTLNREFLDGKDPAMVGLRRQVLLSLLCTNCGHVEQFSQAIVEGVDPSVYGEDVIAE